MILSFLRLQWASLGAYDDAVRLADHMHRCIGSRGRTGSRAVGDAASLPSAPRKGGSGPNRPTRGEPVPYRATAKAGPHQLVAPGDDMGARHDAKFLPPADAGEAHEVLHRVLVDPAGAPVAEIGAPLDFGRHVGQPVAVSKRPTCRPPWVQSSSPSRYPKDFPPQVHIHCMTPCLFRGYCERIYFNNKKDYWLGAPACASVGSGVSRQLLA